MNHLDFRNLQTFSAFMQDISATIGFRVSSRGWAYILEQKRYINKDQFDKVTNTINKCRKKGFLPIDFTAEESARDFSGVERQEFEDVVDDFGSWVTATVGCAEYYTPDWWELNMQQISDFSGEDIRSTFYSYNFFAKCFEMHIDLFDLIPAGLAVLKEDAA